MNFQFWMENPQKKKLSLLKLKCKACYEHKTLLSAVFSKNKVLFVNLCRCMRKKLPTEKTTVKVREEMDRLWQLLQTTLIPVLLLIRKHLDPFNDIAFRGMSFASEEHLFQFCTNLSCSLYLEGIQSWTSNLQIAIKFSEPNKGKQTSSDLLWLLLKKRGYADYS